MDESQSKSHRAHQDYIRNPDYNLTKETDMAKHLDNKQREL